MRHTVAASLLALPLLILDVWGVEAAPPSGDEVAVRAVVQDYFDGMMEGSPDKLRSAFHADAVLIGKGRDGQLTRTPVSRWAAGMTRARQNPEEHRNEIAALDIAGDAAMVKTVLTWPEVTYVDYLSVMKDTDGQWRIVNKIWDSSRS